MGHLEVANLNYQLPTGDSLFDNVSFRVGEGQRVALVGNNGAGKSTLLKILAGELAQDSGTARFSGKVLKLSQNVGFDNDNASVREALLRIANDKLRITGMDMLNLQERLQEGDDQAGIALASRLAEWGDFGGYELEALWDSSCRTVLGLGLPDVEERYISTLSGGERKRLLLTVLLSSDADVLLLDEPDNYLDIKGKEWFEESLSSCGKTVLLVTHDRVLLSKAVDRIVTLEPNGTWTHAGGYDTYEKSKKSREETLGDQVKRWHEEERRLYQHFKLMKQRAAVNDKNAPKADAAETRWKRFAAGGPPSSPVRAQKLALRLEGSIGSKRALTLAGLSIRDLFLPFSAEIFFGERVALVGSNGVGKSHIMRALAGEPLEHVGTFKFGPAVSVGSFTQVNSRDDLVGLTALRIVHECLSNEQEAMFALARYGLQHKARTLYDHMSGGERARLEILMLELEENNFLLLDEPTDNLDLESAAALENALRSFNGTIVTVTHDRAFLRELDRFILLGDDLEVYETYDAETARLLLVDPTAKVQGVARLT